MFIALLSIFSLTTSVPEESYNQAISECIEDCIDEFEDDSPIHYHFLPFYQGIFDTLGYFIGKQNVEPVLSRLEAHGETRLDLAPAIHSLKNLPPVSLDEKKWRQGFTAAIDNIEDILASNPNVSYEKRIYVFGQFFALDSLNSTCIYNEGDFNFDEEDSIEAIGESAFLFLINPTTETQNDLLQGVLRIKQELKQ